MKTGKIKILILLTAILIVVSVGLACMRFLIKSSGEPEMQPIENGSAMAGYVSRYHPAHISSDEAWAMAEAEGRAVLLDIRSEAVYNERHVSGAVNVPPDTVVDYAVNNLPDKDITILCYCFCGDNGGAAYTAYTQLTELGYTKVFYMEPGGEWPYEGSLAAASNHNYIIVNGNEAKELYESNVPSILLDVRNQDEYDEMHIEGSILIPASELSSRLSELPDNDAVIIVYCKSGKRSVTACDILSAAGYENLYDMQSIENWPEPLVVK